MFTVFNLSIFMSAFLLFVIQPMIANMLLPQVGGAPSIWNTCMVFFQISLLIGYFYSYIVSRKLSVKKQITLHGVLLFGALWIINFQFQTDVIDTTRPIIDILYVLFKNIFIPFVLLSTTSPLIQYWLSVSNLKESKNPYALYVCSNIGSLLALYAYPLFFEKKLTLLQQGNIWHILYGIFFCSVVFLGAYLSQHNTVQPKQIVNKNIKKVSSVQIFYWIFLAFIPSSLMLGVTSHLSVDIGGLPFLWILPLSLYLLSFVWTFSKLYTQEIADQFYRLYKVAALVVVFLYMTVSVNNNLNNNLLFIGAHCLFYFIFAVTCHGFLANKKPKSENLTLFYLCLAIGGALGGVLNTFVAPYIFSSIWEYPFVLILSLPFIVKNCPENKKEIMGIIGYILILTAIIAVSLRVNINLKENIADILFCVCVALVLLFTFLKKRNFILLSLCSVIFVLLFFRQEPNIVFQKRNFFGSLTIVKGYYIYPNLYSLNLHHGDTLHGRQNVAKVGDKEFYDYNPSSYYGKKAAVDDFFSVYRKKDKLKIAWLGLGAGTIICYTPKQAEHHIFEINKDIIDISKKYHYFRYLDKCASDAQITIGDARVEISKEKDQKYDLIVIDVFSSHFIPVHLTTKEAISEYRSKLKENGIILFHISSRAFDIEPILSRIAQDMNMTFIVRYLRPFDGNYPQWGVLANSDKVMEIQKLLSMPGWYKSETPENTPLWTDDFHNLLSIMRQ